ncbi:hypothetical protein C8J34_12036 [Rhizobium sp. PP-F2F-G36]|nr:hypothetical protein C8J34_12036 [Rhizobium sp. PP-F2F-G36]
MINPGVTQLGSNKLSSNGFQMFRYARQLVSQLHDSRQQFVSVEQTIDRR